MSSQQYRCLLCQSPDLKSLSGYERAHLVRCLSCGFIFASAIPTTEELIDHYGRYPRNNYLSPVTVKRYNEILDRFEPCRKHNRLLDNGCGIGLFLGVAKERGWEVYGTEFTDDAVAICRDKGICMHQGPLDPANYEPGFFDVVTSFEVIEHINNPLEDVANVAKVLRSGGLFYITTPNFNAVSRLLLKDKWGIVEYPEHLSYYVPRTMRTVLYRSGFDQIRIETTGISVSRIRIGLHIKNQLVGTQNSDDEKIRVMAEQNRLLLAAKNVLNGALNLSGRGDSMKVLARKK